MFDPRRVTLKQLRALVAASEEGSLTSAAARLHVTPPAVSLQLRELEANAGMALLERRKEGFVATQAGLELLVIARRTEAGLRICAEALAGLQGAESGSATLGVVSTAKYFAPRALAAFIAANPKTDVRLKVANRGDTIAALNDFEIDFALMGRPPEGEEYEEIVIGPHPHVIIAPPGHRFARRARLALDDLAEESWLLREEGSGTRALLQTLLARAGLDPRVGMEIGSNETIKQAVMAGMGVALISAHTVASEVADGRLIVLRAQGTPILREWRVVKRAERRLLPAAHALWRFIAGKGAQFLPNTDFLERPRP